MSVFCLDCGEEKDSMYDDCAECVEKELESPEFWKRWVETAIAKGELTPGFDYMWFLNMGY